MGGPAAVDVGLHEMAVPSVLLFDEPFYWMTVAGIVLVMAGVVLIAMRAG